MITKASVHVDREFYNKYMSLDKLYRELEKGSLAGAQALLGWELVHSTSEGDTSGYIVETEAYHQDDPASHTYKGQTLRNSAMFGPAGTIYVYFTYGMHHCVNIVSGKEGIGEGILIRALKPKAGIEVMKQRRGTNQLNQLTNGPAKLVQALGITPLHNATTVGTGDLHLRPGLTIQQKDIANGPRIGISRATEELNRFYIKNNQFVSRK
jgi:DNA-3-methyladenine glycosylase